MADRKDNHPLAVMASVENLSGLYIVSRHYNPFHLSIPSGPLLSRTFSKFPSFYLTQLNTLQIDPHSRTLDFGFDFPGRYGTLRLYTRRSILKHSEKS